MGNGTVPDRSNSKIPYPVGAATVHEATPRWAQKALQHEGKRKRKTRVVGDELKLV